MNKTLIVCLIILMAVISFLAGSMTIDHLYQTQGNYSTVVTKTEYITKEIIKDNYIYVDNDNNSYEIFEVTGYSLDDPEQGTNSTVAIGLDVSQHDFPVVAVDPDVIPLYSIVKIYGLGTYIAMDTGGMIQGKRIDVLFDSKDKAIEFGRQKLPIRVISND